MKPSGEDKVEKTEVVVPLLVDYTNWRGERRVRRILPQGLWFGVSEFHDGEQWFIRALDLDRDDKPMRDFAFVGIHRCGWTLEE